MKGKDRRKGYSEPCLHRPSRLLATLKKIDFNSRNLRMSSQAMVAYEPGVTSPSVVTPGNAVGMPTGRVVTTGMSFPGRRSPYVDHVLSTRACRLNESIVNVNSLAGRTREEREETIDDLGHKLDETMRIVEWKVSSTPPVSMDVVDNKSSAVHTVRQKKRPATSVLGSLVIRGSSARSQRTPQDPYMAWMQKPMPMPYQFLETPKPRPTPVPSDAESCFSISDLNDLPPTPTTSNDEDCLFSEADYRPTTDDILDYYLDDQEEDDESTDLQIQPSRRSPVLRQPMRIVGSRMEYSGQILKAQNKTDEPGVSSRTRSADKKSVKKPRAKSGRVFMGKRVTASALGERTGSAGTSGSPVDCFLNINSPARLNPKRPSVEQNPTVRIEAPCKVRAKSAVVASSTSLFCIKGRKYVPRYDINNAATLTDDAEQRKARAKSAVMKSSTSSVNERTVVRRNIYHLGNTNASSTGLRPSTLTVTVIPM